MASISILDLTDAFDSAVKLYREGDVMGNADVLTSARTSLGTNINRESETYRDFYRESFQRKVLEKLHLIYITPLWHSSLHFVVAF